MTKEQKEYLLTKLQDAKKAFSSGDIEREQWLIEEAINFVDAQSPLSL